MACVARGIECHLARATFWQRNCEAVHAKKKGYLLRSDKLNADLINDTLLNASTHFQIFSFFLKLGIILLSMPQLTMLFMFNFEFLGFIIRCQ